LIFIDVLCAYVNMWKRPSSWNKMNCELMLTYDTPAYMFKRSRNLTGPKTLPTIWHTYMKLVTKYQISAINSCWEKCDEKYLGRTEGRTEVIQHTPPPVEQGYNYQTLQRDRVIIMTLLQLSNQNHHPLTMLK
jgi:hypothetical protein